MKLRALAPGKVNLCLLLGPLREDGRHELVTLFESVSLADELVVEPAARDVVIAPGVQGLNIVSRALEGLRARGWDGPRVRVEIDKRVPVAGGMGGGSADAAAMLRVARRLSPLPEEEIASLAAELGADVPSQLAPGLWLGRGAGERLEPATPIPPHAFVIVPQSFGLSTADVYAEADRLGLPRSIDDLDASSAELGVNDLERPALSLHPEIGDALAAASAAGAEHAFVSGSGPTVVGLCWGEDAGSRALAAAEALVPDYPGATTAVPVAAGFGAPRVA